MTAPTALSLGSMCTGYGGLDLAVAQVLDVVPLWVADPAQGAAGLAVLIDRLAACRLADGREAA